MSNTYFIMSDEVLIQQAEMMIKASSRQGSYKDDVMTELCNRLRRNNSCAPQPDAHVCHDRPAQSEVMFTTSIDNVAIRKGDDYWYCGFGNFKKYHIKVCSWQDVSKGHAQASTEHGLDAYIFANKPTLITVIELALCFETIIKQRGFGFDDVVTTVVDMKKLEALIKAKQQECP